MWAYGFVRVRYNCLLVLMHPVDENQHDYKTIDHWRIAFI